MSINLQVEEYCQECPDFEPVTDKHIDHVEVEDFGCLGRNYEHIYNTTILCKYKKRCAAQMRYLQKQHTEMKKKETGDDRNSSIT